MQSFSKGQSGQIDLGSLKILLCVFYDLASIPDTSLYYLECWLGRARSEPHPRALSTGGQIVQVCTQYPFLCRTIFSGSVVDLASSLLVNIKVISDFVNVKKTRVVIPEALSP
jgi:hypothetical protein